MNIQCTPYATLVPTERIALFITPHRIGTLVDEFALSRGLSTTNSATFPTNSVHLIITSILVGNITQNVTIRNIINSTLSTTPLHGIVEFVDTYYPQNGLYTTATVPFQIKMTKSLENSITSSINNGDFIHAVNQFANYLNTANITRIPSDPAVVANGKHTQITAFHLDESNEFVDPIDEDNAYMHCTYTRVGNDFKIEFPGKPRQVPVIRNGIAVLDEETKQPLMETVFDPIKYNSVPFYNQSSNASTISNNKSVLVPFSSMLLCPADDSTEFQALFCSKSACTFSNAEASLAMRQLIVNTYGPVPEVKDTKLDPRRGKPQLPRSEGPNLDEQRFTAPRQPSSPPTNQDNSAGEAQGQGNRPSWQPQQQGGRGRGSGGGRRSSRTNATFNQRRNTNNNISKKSLLSRTFTLGQLLNLLNININGSD